MTHRLIAIAAAALLTFAGFGQTVALPIAAPIEAPAGVPAPVAPALIA